MLQTIGIREFRNNLQKYTKLATEPVAITSHGEPIGFFIPIAKPAEEKNMVALIEANRKLTALLEEKGISIDELLADFQEFRASEQE